MIIKHSVFNEQFNQLYNEYYSSIYKYCLARLNCNVDYSEDCVQETFVVLYKKLKSGEEINNPRSFLYTTATNFIKKKYNEIQKQNNNIVSIDDVEYMLGANIENELIEKIDFIGFSNKLESILNENEIILFNYRFVDELKIKDIAELLKITPANCSLRITRLRRKIISQLKEIL